MSNAALRNIDIANEGVAAGVAPPTGRRLCLEVQVVLFAVIDVLVFVACGWSSSLLSLPLGERVTEMGADRLLAVAFTATAFILMSHVSGLYHVRRVLDKNHAMRRQIMALVATFFLLVIVGAATKTTQNFSRIWFFSWVGMATLALPLVRMSLVAQVRSRLKNGDFVFRALSVGVFAQPLSSAELRTTSGGLAQVAKELCLSNLTELESLAAWIARAEIDQIYIVAPWVDAPVMLEKLLQLRQFSTEIFVLPDDARIHAHQLGVSVIGDRVALQAAERPISGWSLLAKRVQDVAVASLTLAFLAPVLALVALAIKLETPGPILFRQKRVGFNGNQFDLLKFRSMHHAAADAHASRQTARNDDRVTRTGRFIRRTSLDELPQFVNVLRGDMSVVGPRPHALMTKTNGRELWDIADGYAARHRVKPGLTGLAQVNGCRGELDSYEKVKNRVEYDIKYIEDWSTWLDLKIIFRTVFLLIYDPSAY